MQTIAPPAPISTAAAPTPPWPLVFSQQALADLLGLSTATLKDWRNHGKGPSFVKAGQFILYTGEAVQTWLREHTIVRPRKAKSADDAAGDAYAGPDFAPDCAEPAAPPTPPQDALDAGQ